MQAQIKRASMAGLNKKNVVRFSAIHVTEYHDASVGSKRSAWKSEESSSQRNLPPRRPSRDLRFLSRIPEDLFFVDTDESGIDHHEPSQQLSGSKKQLRSILKTKSKYTTSAPASSDLTKTVSLASSDTRWTDSNERTIVNEKNTFSLIQRHRDSVLDLPQLAQRCKPKFEREGQTDTIPVPSLVFVGNDDDEALEF